LWEADNHGYWSFKGIRGRHKDGTINVGLHRRFQFWAAIGSMVLLPIPPQDLLHLFEAEPTMVRN